MFTGEPYDPSGLLYLRARYYDPQTGRFLTPDTFSGKLKDPLSQNRYIYCGSNPVLYIDPSGHIKLCQWDDLGAGLLGSGVETVESLLATPGALWELSRAIWNGELSFEDLTQALAETGYEIIGPFQHLIGSTNWVFNGDPTDYEVLEYGRNLGHALQAVAGSDAAGKALAKVAPKAARALGIKAAGEAVEGAGKAGFATAEKLESHFAAHGSEFKGAYNTVEEYLAGARDVIANGNKVNYMYKGEMRTGYAQFMGNSSKGVAKFEFVGTNQAGQITTYHVECLFR